MFRVQPVGFLVLLLAVALTLASPTLAAQPEGDVRSSIAYPADEAPKDAPPPAEPPPTKRPISPDAPLDVLVAGDSFAQPLASALQGHARREGMIKTRLDFRISSGLALPSFFNWHGRMDWHMTNATPEAVVLFLGANDTLPMWSETRWLRGASPEWQEEYAGRVGHMMDLVGQRGARLYWVGMPIMRDGWRNQFAATQNEAVTEAAASRPWVTYIDLWTLFSDEAGNYLVSLPDSDGRWVQMRQTDGVHLTWAGTARVGWAVYEAMHSEWQSGQ